MKTKEIFENIFSHILDSKDQEDEILYKEVLEKALHGRENSEIEDLESFYFVFGYPLESFYKKLIKRVFPAIPDQGLFIFTHYNFVERSFCRIFEQIEGSACCADKSRTLCKRIAIFFTKGVKIEFDYAGQYTYHLPKKVFTTNDEILSFYKALQSLYYGRNDLYFKEIHYIYSKIKEENGTAM